MNGNMPERHLKVKNIVFGKCRRNASVGEKKQEIIPAAHDHFFKNIPGRKNIFHGFHPGKINS